MKKYYTFEEAKEISDKKIEEDAKKFAKKSFRNAKKYKKEKREEKLIVKFEDEFLI